MAGVRGFKDPNVQLNNGVPLWHQKVGNLTTKAASLLPWYLNYLGGDYPEATQCMAAGSNGWDANHAALNHDRNDNWPVANTPWSGLILPAKNSLIILPLPKDGLLVTCMPRA
jgi:phospholipase C